MKLLSSTFVIFLACGSNAASHSSNTAAADAAEQIAAATHRHPDGSSCAADSDCSSSFCFAADASNQFCTHVCQRSNTAGRTQNDCLAGQTCSDALFAGTSRDGLSICLTPQEVGQLSGSPVPNIANLYSLAAGNATDDANTCQSATLFPSGDFNLCAASCGATSDCRDNTLLGMDNKSTVCQSELTTLPSFAQAPDGRRFCGESTGAAAGTSCTQASECAEQACGGFCLNLQVEVPNDPGCSSSADCDACNDNHCAVGGAPCASASDCPFTCDTGVGQCKTSTLAGTGSCVTDSDCSAANVCRDGLCFGGAALTGQPCQDLNQCQFGQQCAGSCLAHCNDQKDCSNSDVCAYWVMQPDASASFSGSVWERVCRAPLPATGAYNHVQSLGQSCAADTDCASEVCLTSGAEVGYCSDYCGRAAACSSGYHCATTSRVPYPGATALTTPVCLQN